MINAVAPLFTAVVALLWMGERLSRQAIVGLLVGLGGVVLLVWDKLDLSGDAVTLGIAAAMLASLSYGVAANYIRSSLTGVGSLEIAAGSQLAATVLLAPLCIWLWPAEMPSWPSPASIRRRLHPATCGGPTPMSSSSLPASSISSS